MNAIDTTTIHTNSEDTSVVIRVDGEVKRYHYDDLRSFHQGDSWFGCTVGFRAMQLAASELSDGDSLQNIWSREDLSVISGHPGPGVKDAIELVTGAFSSGQYHLIDSIDSNGCNSSMRFEWWIIFKDRTLHIRLREGIVSAVFFNILNRIINARKQGIEPIQKDREAFGQMKQELSNKLWSQSLDASFNFDYSNISTTNHKMS